jgi:hypothetical protein
MQAHIRELLSAYRGEIAGEAFFLGLAQTTDDPGHAAKWRVLAQLEHEVAERIRPELELRGIPLPSAEADQLQGLESVDEYACLGWRGSLARLVPELLPYVRRFESAESIMPADLLALAQFVTAHERALVEFARRELDHGGERSLDAVHRLLASTPERAAE